MAGITSMHYAANLPTLLENKRALVHYHNTPIETSGVYEADQGWDDLFSNYNVKPKESASGKRAGASARDKLNRIKKQISEGDDNIQSRPDDSETTLKIDQ